MNKLISLFLIVLFSCKNNSPQGGNSRNKDTSGSRSVPVDTTLIFKSIAKIARRVDTVQAKLAAAVSNPVFSTAQIKQINALIASSQTTSLKIIQDTAKRLRSEITELKKSQKKDSVNILAFIKKYDSLANKALTLDSTDFFIHGTTASIKKHSSVDTLINPPGHKGIANTLTIGTHTGSQKDIDISDLKWQVELLSNTIDSMQNIIDRQQKIIDYK